MRRGLLAVCIPTALGRPAAAGVTRDDFVVETTQDLVTPCSVADDDPMRLAGSQSR